MTDELLKSLAARLGTPCYIFDADAFAARVRGVSRALAPGQVCYAMKANSTAGVLQVLARLGAGVDNLFDKRLFRAGNAQGVVGIDGAGAATYNEPGRTFYTSLTASF